MYVAVEGIDGTGKSTVIPLVCSTLKDKYGWSVISTREPHNPLLYTDMENVDNVEQTLFYALDRYRYYTQYMDNFTNYDLVISDRSVYSSIAYQTVDKHIHGYSDVNVSPEWISDVNSYVPNPDLVFVLRSNHVRTILERKGDIVLTDESVEYYMEVQDNYLDMAEMIEENWVVLDADNHIELIVDTMVTVIIEKYYNDRIITK